LPGELIESELFGHVKGAFTSAHADKDGKFLVAGSGTILLDEIDVLTPDQQVKLLRVIEKGEFEPVGSNKTLHVKARIIAASNLAAAAAGGVGPFSSGLVLSTQYAQLYFATVAEATAGHGAASSVLRSPACVESGD
jgi:DNA-binding NtrC family response regulator